MTGKPAYKEREERIRLLEEELVRLRSCDEMPQEGDQRYLAAEGERNHSQQEARRLAAEQVTLAEIGRIISSTPEIEKIYEQFATIAKILVPFDSLSVNLVNLPQKTFRFAYNFGRDAFDERVGLEIPLTGSMTELVVRQQKTLLFNASDVAEITRLFPTLTMVLSFHAGFLSNMLVPLFAKNAVIGVLHFRARRLDAFGEEAGCQPDESGCH